MPLRDKIGLYGSYFLGMAGIGFTLPYLPLYLQGRGLSDRAIGLVSTLAALAGLAQFPVGVASDRIGRRKPFLIAALAAVAASAVLLPAAAGLVGITLTVLFFAENGAGRAAVESLSGALAADLAGGDGVGSALGALRFWKPIGIVLTALLGGLLVERYGLGSLLGVVALLQCGAVAAALLIVDRRPDAGPGPRPAAVEPQAPRVRPWRDPALLSFVAAMVLFHAANAPGGVYLGLFLKHDLHAPDRVLAYAFAVSMAPWMLVVLPAGRLADRIGRRPLLIAAWAVMAARLAIVAAARSSRAVIATQALDGLANGLFAVLAAAWVSDRLADPRRQGEAQVIVGCALVTGSALGPALSGLAVGSLGYRGLFTLLAEIVAVATGLVVLAVPETLPARRRVASAGGVRPALAGNAEGRD